MKVDLKIRPEYDGFLFLARSVFNPPPLAPHRHAELELNLVARGRIIYVVDGERLEFRQGDLLWFFPAHGHQLVDRSSDAEYYVAVFKQTMIREACPGALYRPLHKRRAAEGVPHRIVEPLTFDLLRHTMDSLIEGAPPPEQVNREAGYGAYSAFVYHHSDPAALNAGLRHLLLQSWRCMSTGHALRTRIPLHPSVAKALSLLSGPGGSLSLDDLAAACGTSAPYLSRMFARQIGVSVSQYRNTVRLGRFLEIYRGPGRPSVLDAALEAGFGSYPQFHKIFTETYGMPPGRTPRGISEQAL